MIDNANYHGYWKLYLLAKQWGPIRSRGTKEQSEGEGEQSVEVEDDARASRCNGAWSRFTEFIAALFHAKVARVIRATQTQLPGNYL